MRSWQGELIGMLKAKQTKSQCSAGDNSSAICFSWMTVLLFHHNLPAPSLQRSLQRIRKRRDFPRVEQPVIYGRSRASNRWSAYTRARPGRTNYHLQFRVRLGHLGSSPLSLSQGTRFQGQKPEDCGYGGSHLSLSIFILTHGQKGVFKEQFWAQTQSPEHFHRSLNDYTLTY